MKNKLLFILIIQTIAILICFTYAMIQTTRAEKETRLAKINMEEAARQHELVQQQRLIAEQLAGDLKKCQSK